MKVISFYTENPSYYKANAARFVQSLKSQGWADEDIYVQAVDAGPTWTDRINYKATFIRDCMDRFKGEWLLWMDIDGIFSVQPSLRFPGNVDFLGFRKPAPQSKRTWQIAALAFAPSYAAYNLVSTWRNATQRCTMNKTHPLLTDEYFFDLAWRWWWQEISTGNLGDYIKFQNITTGNATSINQTFGKLKRIKAWWSRSPKPGNFGDILTPWYIERELGLQPIYSMSSDQDAVMGSGSTLRFAKGAKVWGSGIFFWRDSFHGRKEDLYAVRGPHSRKVVDVESLPLGDPGLLLPFFNPKTEETPQEDVVGIVPHYVHWDVAQAILGKSKGVRLIHPIRSNPFKVAEEIASCKAILSSSLHGLVAAQAYGIPWGWIHFEGSKRKLDGDGVKFTDFFDSLDPYLRLDPRPECVTVRNPDDGLRALDHLHWPNKEYTNNLCLGLWEVCPFNLVNLVNGKKNG